MNAMSFQGMLSSVLESQDSEVILGKQPILSDYGREVRAALNALPPEVSRGLMNEYRTPTPQLVSAVENSIMSRELAIENAEQGVNLDQNWLASAQPRGMSETALSAEDEWNVDPNM